MAVVLEASQYAPRDRNVVIQDTIAAIAPAKVTLHAPPERVALRAEGWQLDDLYLLRVNGTGFRLTRTEREVRKEAPEVAVLIQSTGAGSVYTAHGATQQLAHEDLNLCDLTSTYDYVHTHVTGGASGAHVPYETLGLSVDTIRAAVPRLHTSPVMPLLRGHLTQVFASIDAIASDVDVARAVSAATIELTRAVVVSAAADRRTRDVLHETVAARVASYVRQHLREPDLTPARIAHANNISLRTLYNIWPTRNTSIAEWIINQRLDGARRELADGDPASTVAATARRWGFTDPTHFSRRFRAAYGMPPGQYRTTNRDS